LEIFSRNASGVAFPSAADSGFKPKVTYADVVLGESFNFAPALAPGGGQGGQQAKMMGVDEVFEPQ
jgi:hypothetical protein